VDRPALAPLLMAPAPVPTPAEQSMVLLKNMNARVQDLHVQGDLFLKESLDVLQTNIYIFRHYIVCPFLTL